MKLPKNLWMRAGGMLALFVLLAVLMLRWFEHKTVFQPTAHLDAHASALGRPAEDVFIPVDGDGKIEAWFFPAGPDKAPGAHKAILICHGNGGNISHRLDLCALLLETGVSVLVFDYRGYGQSPGRPSEEGTYQDAQAAYQWLREKGFAATNIVGYGESLGGGVVTELAVREPLGGLILQSTFTSIPDIGSEIFPWLPVRLVGAIKYDTVRKLPGLKIPVLIIHSRGDTTVPYHHAEKNFAAAREPKTFCEIRGDHNDGIITSRAQIVGAVEKFLAGLKM